MNVLSLFSSAILKMEAVGSSKTDYKAPKLGEKERERVAFNNCHVNERLTSSVAY
jgi:hypothetical protein